MAYPNTIIYLIGSAGVGKRTIAQEICSAEPYFKLYDNHTLNNVIFPFVRMDGKTKIPERAWQSIRTIRKIALNALVEIGNPQHSYVFTNHLNADDANDVEIYMQVQNAAEKIGACFVPVRLVCDADEHKKRISSEGRDALYKVTNPAEVDGYQGLELYMPDHENTFDLDITHLSAQDSAHIILDHVGKVYIRR